MERCDRRRRYWRRHHLGDWPRLPLRPCRPVGLAFFFRLGLPSFISSCGLGGWRMSAPMSRFVSLRSSLESDMTDKPLGLDDDYKLALGTLVIEVSKLDGKITELISALTRTNIAHAIIMVHQQPFAQKLDALRSLLRLIYPSDDDPNYIPIKETLDKIKEVAEFRNIVVHALWHVGDDGTPHAVRFRAKGTLKRSRVPAPIEHIHQKTLEAHELVRTLGILAQGFREWSKATPPP